MAIQTVGILTPGEMGHALGNVLRQNGLRVITCLRGRSQRTAALAAAAGIEDVADDETLVREAEALLSVLAPAGAPDVAARVAAALRATGAELLYVDCNAVAPRTVRQIGSALDGTGARFVDAGIIGGPPRPGERGPRLYASGEPAAEFAELARYGLDVRVMGAEIGQASGLKMCYAALTKGLNALATELLVAGAAMGLSEPLRAELASSQATLLACIERDVPRMPPKAYRWIREMEEIAATFEDVGLTPRLLAGAADMFRFVERTPLGAERPEARTRGATLDEVVAILAESLAAQPAASPAD